MSTLLAQSLADQLAEFRLRHDCGIPVDLDALLVAAADFADTFESTIEGLNRVIAETQEAADEEARSRENAQDEAAELKDENEKLVAETKRLSGLIEELKMQVSA